MVVKKKVLYLGLLVSLLGIGSVIQAYKLTVENRTRFSVTCRIKYVGESKFFKSCRPDILVIKPRSISVDVSSGACSVLSVRAEMLVGSRMIKARSYIPLVGKAATSTLVISKHGEGFKVFRVKYRKYFKLFDFLV